MIQITLRTCLIIGLFLQTLNIYSQEATTIEKTKPIQNAEYEKIEKKLKMFPINENKITRPYTTISERDIDLLIVRRVIETFTGPINPKTGKNPVNWTQDLYRHFVDEHWKYGVQDEIEWSLAYSWSNMGMRCWYVALNKCASPMDVPNGDINPYKNITHHCKEMAEYYGWGRRGYYLIKTIFYPAAPRDWNHGRIYKAKQKVDKCVKRGIEVGKIPASPQSWLRKGE